MYNDKLFVPASIFSIMLNYTPSNSINCATFKPHNDMPNTKASFKYSSIDIPSIDKSTTLPSTINHSNISK